MFQSGGGLLHGLNRLSEACSAGGGNMAKHLPGLKLLDTSPWAPRRALTSPLLVSSVSESCERGMLVCELESGGVQSGRRWNARRTSCVH